MKAALSPLGSMLRIVRGRPRLFISVLIGCVVALLVPSQYHFATRSLFGWNAGVALYLALVYQLMASSTAAVIRTHAAREDEGRNAILALVVASALATLFAIVFELGTSQGSPRQSHALLLAIVTILLTWTFIHIIFALHYAHQFYGEGREMQRGLNFPKAGDKDQDPDYWDFFYFSFVIGMTAQVSDVSVTSKAVRRTVAAHGIVSFIFNTAILALTVNIAASAI